MEGLVFVLVEAVKLYGQEAVTNQLSVVAVVVKAEAVSEAKV